MKPSAVLAFESALQQRMPDTVQTPAGRQFEALLKAKRPSKKAKPENPTGALGRGTGAKDTSFESVNPHLVHGGTFKLLPSTNPSKPGTPIGPTHAMYHHESMADSPEYKVHNPLETISRIGYRAHQTLQAHEQIGYENPNHPHHVAYLYKQTNAALHPESSHMQAFRGKKGRGVHPQVAVRNVTSGAFSSADNQYTAGKDNPRTLGESLGRIWNAAGVRESDGKAYDNRSKHATNFVHSSVRAEAVTRGLNRMFHVARGLKDKFHGEMDHEELHGHLMSHNLADFSGRREIQGFHQEHLGSKHNPKASADFKAGKPAWKPNPYFARAKKEAHPLAAHLGSAAERLDNFQDLNDHLASLPVGGHGNSKELKDKLFIAHRLPGEAAGALQMHHRIRGTKPEKK